jgi:hypothetical protein
MLAMNIAVDEDDKKRRVLPKTSKSVHSPSARRISSTGTMYSFLRYENRSVTRPSVQ